MQQSKNDCALWPCHIVQLSQRHFRSQMSPNRDLTFLRWSALLHNLCKKVYWDQITWSQLKLYLLTLVLSSKNIRVLVLGWYFMMLISWGGPVATLLLCSATLRNRQASWIPLWRLAHAPCLMKVTISHSPQFLISGQCKYTKACVQYLVFEKQENASRRASRIMNLIPKVKNKKQHSEGPLRQCAGTCVVAPNHKVYTL